MLEYAEVIDGLSGQWMATGPMPSGGQVAPYQTGAGGGYVATAAPVQSPPVGAPTRVLDLDYEAETYTTPTGARAWKPTAADEALIDYVTGNPYAGVDELLEAQGDAAVKAAGRGFQNMPYVGDVVGGAVEGAAVYGRTGSLTHGVLAGGGATAGGIVGTAIGGGLGAIAGPPGAIVGGIVGGAVGSALGSLLGQGLANLIDPLPEANLNGATEDGDPPFTGGQCVGAVYRIEFSFTNDQGNRQSIEQIITARLAGAYSEPGPFGSTRAGYVVKLPNGTTQKFYQAATSDPARKPNPSVRVVRREDGGVDNCGDPDPTQVVTAPNFPDVTGERDPAPELPGPQPNPNPRTRSPRTPITGPLPFPVPNPIRLPFPIGGPIPGGEPVPGDDGEKQPYPTPSPNPNPDPPNPNPTQPDGDDGGPCDPCAELRDIKAKLEETFTLAWSLPVCGEVFPVNRTGEKTGQGLAGLSQKLDALYQTIRVIHDNTRCESDNVVVIPDSWPIKAESQRPQLILLYADKKPDGTIGNRRYQFSVPHADGKLRKALKSIIPKEIKKGSEQGTYVLRDNSKIITYCRNKTEAMRVMKAFDRLVLKGMKTENMKTGGINPSTRFLEISIFPYEARYFSQGQAQLTPDWKEKLI